MEPIVSRIPGPDGHLAIHDWGGTGPHLLLMHAASFHGRAFEPVVQGLRAHAHVWSFDFRGHGDSDPDIDGYAWSGFGTDAGRVLDALRLDPPPLGVAHSMGAAASIMAEAAVPGRFRSLVLVEPVTPPPDYVRQHEDLLRQAAAMIDVAARRRERWPDLATARRWLAERPPMDRWDAQAFDAYVRHGLVTDGQTVHLRCSAATESRIYQQGFTTDAFVSAERLRLPVTVVYGSETWPVYRDWARSLAEQIPDAKLIELAGLGHLLPFESPSRLCHVVATAFDLPSGGLTL